MKSERSKSGTPMEALLEFRGRDFSVERALINSPLRAHARVWHSGGATGFRRRPVHEDSGCAILIGSGEELAQQIATALKVLKRDDAAIRRLAAWPEIDSACLRFGELWQPDQVAAKFSRLPNELLRRCGELGLEIVVCQYLSSDDAEPVPHR